jgi:hypothetical protein
LSTPPASSQPSAGLTIERVVEPVASAEIAAHHPEVADTRIIPFCLIVRAHRAHRS